MVAVLMVLSMAAALTAASSLRAKAKSLVYNPTQFDDLGRDGVTKPYLKARGNVGVASDGVGFHNFSYQNPPTQPPAGYADLSKENTEINHIPLDVSEGNIKKVLLYWAGNFGEGGDGLDEGVTPEDPDGTSVKKMIFEDKPVTGVLVGSEFMDAGDHRRLLRADITGLFKDEVTPDLDNGYNMKYKIQPGFKMNAGNTPTHENPHIGMFGASLVVVYTSSSITSGFVCIADGCNIMDVPDQDDPGGVADGSSSHIEGFDVEDFSINGKRLPSASKGIIGSDGEADDLVGYKFKADPLPPDDPPAWTSTDILSDTEGQSWDDVTRDIAEFVTLDTTTYKVDMWNADSWMPPFAPGQTNPNPGGYCDLYVDWFYFSARIDLKLTKSSKLVVDADGNGKVSPGDTLEYTLKYRNAGDTAANDVVLTDDLDTSIISKVSDVSGNATYSSPARLTWEIGKLESGSASQTVTYRATLKPGGQFPATGKVDLKNLGVLQDRGTGALVTASNTVTIDNPLAAAQKIPGSKIWYLAEGSTGSDGHGNFESWVLLQNAGTKEAKANLTYQTPAGEVPGPAVTLKPNTRTTIDVGKTVADNWSVSTKVTSDEPIIAERAMYWANKGGNFRESAHDSIGVMDSANSWFLAEGSTGADDKGRFETWILLQNPGDKEATPQITYMTPAGPKAGPSPTLKPHTRETFNVSDVVPNTWSVSTSVTSAEPIIAERAMYWHAQNAAGELLIYRQAAHDSIGVKDAAKEWFLAEGSTGADDKGQFESWILLQNPGTKEAKAEITYMTPKGPKAGPTPTLAPGTRDTFNVAANVPGDWSVSAKVTSDEPIIAERAMYWHSSAGIYRQAAHDSIGVTQAGNTWFLAEGSTGSDSRGGFETWVLLQNAGTLPANIQIVYMTENGPKNGPSKVLQPNTRETFNVANTVANNWSVSTKVTSNQPVIAERAMYWSSASGIFRLAAHDSIGIDP